MVWVCYIGAVPSGKSDEDLFVFEVALSQARQYSLSDVKRYCSSEYLSTVSLNRRYLTCHDMFSFFILDLIICTPASVNSGELDGHRSAFLRIFPEMNGLRCKHSKHPPGLIVYMEIKMIKLCQKVLRFRPCYYHPVIIQRGYL